MNTKTLLIAIVICLPFCAFGQKITSYKAINGITYHIDDTVRLNKGSNANGSFLYIEDRGPALPFPPQRPSATHNLPKEYANGGVMIKSMRMMKVNGVDKCLFMVNVGTLFRYSIFIDDAITACEVKPCATENSGSVSTGTGSVADEIKKLKDLLDAGAITKEEYEKQKKKLLGE